MALKQAIADARKGKRGVKPILILINRPYAESGSGTGKGDENKIGVEKTRINSVKCGALSRENGSVTINWEIIRLEEPTLKFHWSEMGLEN